VINFPYYVYQLPIQAPSKAALYAAFRLPKRCKIKKKNKKVLYKNMPADYGQRAGFLRNIKG